MYKSINNLYLEWNSTSAPDHTWRSIKLIKEVSYFHDPFGTLACCILLLDFTPCKTYNEFLHPTLYMFSSFGEVILNFGEVILKKRMNIENYLRQLCDLELSYNTYIVAPLYII